MADYIPAKTVRFEDYCDKNYFNDYGDYDEENDCYWTPEGWYEYQLSTNVNFLISDGEVSHWMPLFEVPDILIKLTEQ